MGSIHGDLLAGAVDAIHGRKPSNDRHQSWSVESGRGMIIKDGSPNWHILWVSQLPLDPSKPSDDLRKALHWLLGQWQTAHDPTPHPEHNSPNGHAAGFDRFECDSGLYWRWSILGRLVILSRGVEAGLGDNEDFQLLARALRVDAFLLSMAATPLSPGRVLTWHAGMREPPSTWSPVFERKSGEVFRRATETGCWSKKAADLLLYGNPPRPTDETTEASAFRKAAHLVHNDGPLVPIATNPKGDWMGRYFLRSEELPVEQRIWLGQRFLETSAPFRWSSTLVRERFADGTVASRMMAKGGGGNTADTPALVKRPGQAVAGCYVQRRNGVPINSVRGDRIGRLSIEFDGKTYRARSSKWPDPDEIEWPQGTPAIRVETGPEGARCWVAREGDLEEVQRPPSPAATPPS